jgi:hypothetical protein
MNENDVIRIGRRRVRAACMAASPEATPSSWQVLQSGIEAVSSFPDPPTLPWAPGAKRPWRLGFLVICGLAAAATRHASDRAQNIVKLPDLPRKPE